MEFQNYGSMEFLDHHILELWNSRTMEFQNYGIVELQNHGITEFTGSQNL